MVYIFWLKRYESTMKIIIYLTILSQAMLAQTLKFEANDFIKRTRLKYYRVNLTADIIVSDVSSTSFQNYLASKTNEITTAPLKVEWSQADGIYISPTEYSLDVSDFAAERDNLKRVVESVLVAWSAFFVEKQIPDSAMNFHIDNRGDRVFFSHIAPAGKNFARISKEFGLNGQLLEVRIQQPKAETVVLRPVFNNSNGVYVCQGWFYQRISQDGDILEGMTATIEHILVEDKLFPARIQLDVQTSSKQFTSYHQTLLFSKYTMNDVPVE